MHRTLLVGLALLMPATASAWGFDGHRRLARMMQDPLPSQSCLRQWIQANQGTTLQNQATDPDRWWVEGTPGYDPKEWPRHYLSIDYANPVTSYPREWSEVKDRFGFYAEGNGQVPWRVEEYYGLLVDAFRSKNSATILATLAHLSHYVTDAFSVLHNTRNFDPNGLHQRWETDMLNSSSRIDALSVQAAQFFGTVGRADPRHRIFDIVEVGNGLVAELITADQSHPADMTAFFTAVREMTARRWGDALTLQASLVASAWVDAGAPVLPGMPSACTMNLPQGEMVLVGYKLPPPRPDAGTEPADAGVVTEDGGSSGSSDGNYLYIPPPPVQEGGCGCSGGWGLLGSAPLWLLLAFRRRRP